MQDTINLIRQLAASGFYGSLTLKFEAGHIVTLKKEETIKPNYRDNRGEQNARSTE